MNIDNFLQIENFIANRFYDDNTFYFVQVIKRKKDNPDADKSVRILKTYYVYDMDYLVRKEDEIKRICDENNARAYINLNPRSDKKVAIRLLKELADAISNEQYRHVSRLYDSCCGQTSYAKEKLWLVDIDFPCKYDINAIKQFINSIKPENADKIKLQLSSKNGLHIFSTPFDLKTFAEKYPEIDVHKDNPTILYCCNRVTYLKTCTNCNLEFTYSDVEIENEDRGLYGPFTFVECPHCHSEQGHYTGTYKTITQ